MDKTMLICMLGALILNAPVLSQTTSSTTQTTSHFSSAQSTLNSSTTVMTSQPTTPKDGSKHLYPPQCLFCKTNNTCQLYPKGKILPSADDCALSEARWGVCWLNFEAMIISLSVIGGVIIMTITFCCIYCCCCRNRGKKKQEKDDKKFETQKMERKAKQDDRRTERKGRMDDIRKKYGLMKDDAPYQRFES